MKKTTYRPDIKIGIKGRSKRKTLIAYCQSFGNKQLNFFATALATSN